MCWAAPDVHVLRDGHPPVVVGPVTAAEAPRLLNSVAAGAVTGAEGAQAFLAPQRRVLLERCGMADPSDIADALRHGAYAALADALEEDQPERVIEEVGAERFIEEFGADHLIEKLGYKEIAERMGIERYLASLTPAKRRELKRRLLS